MTDSVLKILPHSGLDPLRTIYSHYLSYVQYAINDPSEGEEGLSWLLGKCFIRHGYDLFPAISELESDLSQQIRKFQQAFTVQSKHALHQHIIAPLQTLLPILHQSLSQSNWKELSL